MKIAICDDKESFHKILKNYLEEYSLLHHIDIDYYDYFFGRDLIVSNIKHDLIFMDYKMDGLDGLETSEALRQKKINIPIIFLTSYPHIVFDAFKVNTYRFLLKPIDKEKLFDAMNGFLQQLDGSNFILVKTDETVKRINIHDIIYVEASGKSCYIRDNEESNLFKGTLTEIEKMLPQDMFFRSHRAYIVGFKHIVSHDATYIMFDNKERALISKMKLTSFKKAFSDFIKRYTFS